MCNHMGFHHVGQAGLELLTSGDSPTSASQSTGLIGVSHLTPTHASVSPAASNLQSSLQALLGGGEEGCRPYPPVHLGFWKDFNRWGQHPGGDGVQETKLLEQGPQGQEAEPAVPQEARGGPGRIRGHAEEAVGVHGPPRTLSKPSEGSCHPQSSPATPPSGHQAFPWAWSGLAVLP